MLYRLFVPLRLHIDSAKFSLPFYFIFVVVEEVRNIQTSCFDKWKLLSKLMAQFMWVCIVCMCIILLHHCLGIIL